MANYRLKLSTLSPVHIGAGQELRMGFDFMLYEKLTWRLNEDAILAAKEKQLQVVRDGRYPLPGQMLNEADFDNPRFFRYVLRGTPRSSKTDARLQACIKDPFDRPFIPGSSLKGALRTALAWTGWDEVKPRLDRSALNNSRQWAGQNLEHNLFGPNPNKDLLRALQVSDSFTEARPDDCLIVVNAQVVTPRASGSPIELEAIRPNQVFTGSLRVDDTLFSEAANRVLGFNNRKRWLEELLPRAQKHSLARIAELQEWFTHVDLEGADKIAAFYRQLQNANLGANQALVQVGWGSGWDGKTFWTHLKRDEGFFEAIVSQYRLNRAGNSRRQRGDAFPKSRRTAMSTKTDAQGRQVSRLSAPFGWMIIELEED
ncbi:hypothetical protein ADN00_14255 [Ornatilinea apprima]|uniref:CRISPR system Cms protein Csm5 n=1 Tax=Ornatilinea apprima TaxID=1134406 RepID=A0A0N8GLX7_9CHLR|nr:type III-A CRISPR-associated RAMP protein Csm5 [Ornatilinea apprima]KPL73730.1 hypothetical protein ADN00_14255 [Ornatilinea apprima]